MIKYTEELAKRNNLKPPFSAIFVGYGGILDNGAYDLWVDFHALTSLLDPLGKALENESLETRDLVTEFLRLVNDRQQNPWRQISEQWIN
jgi:hypothetical protein